MGWHVSDTWMAALSAPHTLRWLVSAVRGDQVLADNMEVSNVSLTASIDDDGTQITREFKCDVADAARELLTTDPMSPLAPWGQRLQVRAELSVGAAYAELIPVGEFRIEAPEGDAATATLQSNGTWLYGGQKISVTCRDMLQQLADETWTTPLQVGDDPANPGQPGTATSELGRVLAGTGLHLSPKVTSSVSIGWGLDYGATRLDSLLALAGEISAATAAWTDRTGAVALIDTAVGTGTEWTASPGEDVWVTWNLGADRQNIKNGVLVQTADDSSIYGIRGADWIKDGPLAWGGPFGRVPEVITNASVYSSAAAADYATQRLATIGKARTAQVVINEPTNPAKDVGDTQHIVTDDRTLTGQIIGIDIGSDATMRTTVRIPWEQVWIS